MKRRGGLANDKFLAGHFGEVLIDLFDVFEGKRFSFVCNRDFGNVIEGRKVTELAVLEDVLIKMLIIIRNSGGDNGMVWLIGLDEDVGRIEMAASDTSDDLSEEMEGFFFGRKIW